MHSIGNSICDCGEELLKIYKPFFVEVCIKWVSAIMSPKMFVPEMSTVPKCLFP